MKLKAIYMLVEQLYTGAQRTLATIYPTNEGSNLLSDVLKKLSILPTGIQEIKRSCARAGVVTALSRAKAWVPELDPADVASGYPTLKEDGTSFDQQDFATCVKAIRPHATVIAEETNLSKYQPAYDTKNQKMSTPAYKVMDLIPPIRKHTFAPEIDPSNLIDDEAESYALHCFDWSKPNFQTAEEDEEPARDEPEAANQQGQED